MVVVRLGEITCPCGELVIADGGYLGIWSGDQSPATIDPAVLSVEDPRTAVDIAGALDFEIIGPDAVDAARAFDLQPGRSLYDIPASGAAEVIEEFTHLCREQGFDARLQARDDRVSHRQRVRRCTAAGGGGFFAFGVPMVAIGGLPVDRKLPVTGIRGPAGRWLRFRVVISEEPVEREVRLGYVAVDWARVAFADADGLGMWLHHEPVDGLADVVFWGAAQEAAAVAHGAPRISTPGDDGNFGWTGLTVEDAVDRYQALSEWISADSGRRMVIDLRPHSHHWQVMRDVRASEYEAGSIGVGGAEILFAMTGWGDGFYPVNAEYDELGNLAAVVVVLGDEGA